MKFFEDNRIKVFATPPECLHLSPIESLWHELKYYLCEDSHKARDQEELIAEIQDLWCETASSEKYKCYIDHGRTVIPKIFEVGGKSTRF
jgi:transposase